MKVTGVEHEFSTVPHVKEDVTDIILNLKRIVFVMHEEVDEHEVHLVRGGPGEVTAKDIELPSAVEVVDPDAYIAALEEGGRLEMQLPSGAAVDTRPPTTTRGMRTSWESFPSIRFSRR